MSHRTRHIPLEVVRQLRADARDRCCLRGHLIPEDELAEAMELDVLHLHHIVYFSEDGPNTEDNLIFVCPTCHAKIHKSRDAYPIERLREAKVHWTTMRKLVPPELEYETEDGEFFRAERIQLSFKVESFNLEFSIGVPAQVTVRELGTFVANWILRPLVYYARTAPYPSILAKAHVTKAHLAFESAPDEILREELPLAEMRFPDHTPLIAMADLRMVHALSQVALDDEEEVPIETAILRWGETPHDLDLHFFVSRGPDRDHVWYRSLGTLERFPWAKLSGDVTTGHGPEVLSFGMLARGVYTIAVHNYSHDAPLAGCGATLELRVGDVVKTYTCPRHGSGDWWVVLEWDMDRQEHKERNIIVAEPPFPILGQQMPGLGRFV